MYSVFLVEDEIVTREGIRSSVPWDTSPYTLIGEAPDGEMALPVIRDLKPDILITDIRMPFMDGLALSRIVKREQPWIKIIILSGHDEFQYAQEAISIGVEEYLLKPVSSQDMVGSLEKVTRRIEAEKRHLTSLESMRLKIKSSEEAIGEKWLCDLVSGQVDTVNAIERAQELGMDLVSNGYVILLVDIAASVDNYAQLSVVKALIASVVKGRDDVFLFSSSVDKQTILFKNTGKSTLDDTVYALAQAIKFETERNSPCRVSIGIGSVVEHVGEIIRSYAEADKAVRYMALNGKNNIIGVNDMQWNEAGRKTWLDGNPVVERLRFASDQEVDELLERYREILGEQSGQSGYQSYYLMVFGDLVDAISALIEELQGDPRAVIPDAFKRELIIEATHSYPAFQERLRSLIEQWIHFRDSLFHNRHRSMILKAKQYIDDEYMSQDISLNSVASFVAVSPNHFSTIFSQESGETFIEYLTNVRIGKAKQLLSGSKMRCSDIAYEVGYGDPHYFSFIFKKTMGLSPREYRAKTMEKA